MSNTLSEIVALTAINPAPKKAVLREIADTVRENDLAPRFYRSLGNTALRLGVSRSTVSKYIKELEHEGLIFQDGTEPCPHGETIKYGIVLRTLLLLPCIEESDRRNTLAEKLPSWTSQDDVVTSFRIAH